jgi:hypothetical protein
MAPTRRKSGSGKANTRLSPAQRKYESAIEDLQKRLSSRLWLIFSLISENG